MHRNSKDQKTSRDFITNMMSERLDNKEIAKNLIPQFALGCRRMTPGSGYLESLSKENVEVIHESAVRLTETGIVDGSGVEHEVDVVICATGFHTSFTPQFKVAGRNDADVHEQFGDFPTGYLGITAENFPNFFSKTHLHFNMRCLLTDARL
jgi:cation diffusion facilitator CzcD-associated flavoprotein CzcO